MAPKQLGASPKTSERFLAARSSSEDLGTAPKQLGASLKTSERFLAAQSGSEGLGNGSEAVRSLSENFRATPWQLGEAPKRAPL